jgi:hypothetical protein
MENSIANKVHEDGSGSWLREKGERRDRRGCFDARAVSAGAPDLDGWRGSPQLTTQVLDFDFNDDGDKG